MDRDLENKIAVITGGAEGIGFEIADNFLEKGAKIVILLDINATKGAESKKLLATRYGGNRVAFIRCDVRTDLEEVSKKIFETYTNVDVLVNNAGIFDCNSPKNTIDVNVTAVIDWTFKFWENMRKDRNGNGGTIINLASIYGFRVDQYIPLYQASKFAVMGFTKSLGHEYNYDRSGVRVVAICPGYTKTQLTADLTITDEQKLQADYTKFLGEQAWQEVEAVGRAAVEVFEKADSGTAWLIEGAKPVVQVS